MLMDDRDIEELKSEIQNLKKWQADMNMLMSSVLDMLESGKKNDDLRAELDKLWRFSTINRFRIDSLPFEITDNEVEGVTFKPQILSVSETRRKLADERVSFTRLGDGEFSAIAGMARWNFQNVSEKLGVRIKEVLENDKEGLLIGLNPNFYGSLATLSEADADGVRAYMRPEVRKFHASLLKRNVIYGDALFHNIRNEEDVKELKRIWDGRKILIVEGEHTGSGVGNDLFDNAAEIARILCPAENAFDRYDEIMKEAVKLPKDYLVLIALGPTATVLAYDLHNEGYQAVDIGHTDLIYEKYLRKCDSLYKVRIDNKYCSTDEQGERRQIPEITDAAYLKQIIAKVI